MATDIAAIEKSLQLLQHGWTQFKKSLIGILDA